MRQENDLISSLSAGSIAPPSWPPRRGSSWWGWRSHACGGSPRYLAWRGTGPHTGRAVLHLSWFGLHYLRHALYCNYAITLPFVIFKFFLNNPNVYSNHNFHRIVKQIFCISRVVKKNSKSKYDSKGSHHKKKIQNVNFFQKGGGGSTPKFTFLRFWILENFKFQNGHLVWKDCLK